MLAAHHSLTHPDNQRGWVLVVGLVVLVMLTILAMALMKTTRLEEKMAGATRDMNLSFQAAETALRAAESFIEVQTLESIFDSNTLEDEIYSQTEDEPKNLFTIDWNDKSAEIVGDLEGITLLPRYMIKKMKQKIRVSPTATTNDAVVFRITVRGTGGTNNRATFLRSHYAKKFSGGSPMGRRLSWEQLFPSQ